MNTPFGKAVQFLSFFLILSLSSILADDLPKDFWVSEEAEVNLAPKQIWVDSFSMDLAKESIDKSGREYHLFKTEIPFKLQEEVVKSLMKIAASKPLWVTTVPQDIWIIKGNITYIGDSVSEQGFWRRFTKNFNNSLGIQRVRTEVFVYDSTLSKENYVIKFETGSNGDSESMNLKDTASFIQKCLITYLESQKK